MGFGENMPLDVLFVRDDDIPDLVQEDVCDLGLVGRNVLEEKRLELISRGHAATFTELRTLEYGRCRLSLAVPEGFSYEGARSIAGKRIATTYPFTLERYLRERNITADIVTLSGAVEIAPRLGRADLICDLVSTGSTLQANHLREVETVLESQALLIRTPVALVARQTGMGRADPGAHRRRPAGAREQVHHAARAALGAAGNSPPASRQRIPHHHSARRLERQSGDPRRVPRERVLGNAREPEEGGREFAAGPARREDAGLR